MSFITRQKFRRGVLPALLAALLLSPLLAGCGEDRSNLIPSDTADSLISKFDEVQSLAASGQCFAAAEVAADAQRDVESLNEDVDPRLKRSLLDGVTDLQVLANDPAECTESGVTTEEEPIETEEIPETEGTTGETGTTDSGQTTGEQGDNDDDRQDSNQQQNNGNGNGNGNGNQPSRPTTPNPTNPVTPPTNPTTPTTPGGPGSGGLGPG